MKAIFSISWLAFLFQLFPPILQAQEKIKPDTLSSSFYGRSYGRADLSYASDWVFAGRKDSVKAPYLTPAIGYYHKSGLFVKASLSYLTAAAQQRVDMFGLSGGYFFQKRNFYAGVNTSGWFFNDSSYTVQSAVRFNGNVFAGYDFGIADLMLGGTIMTGSSTSDFLAGAELSHMFFTAADRLKITPSVYLLMGTQQYYNEYYSTRSSGIKGRGGQGQGSGSGSGGSSQTVQTVVTIDNSRQFQALAWEFSLPVSYTIKKLSLHINPVYAIPVNPSVVTIDQTQYKESLSNVFYLTAGIRYKLLTR